VRRRYNLYGQPRGIWSWLTLVKQY
jgi:hypothetical protein